MISNLNIVTKFLLASFIGIVGLVVVSVSTFVGLSKIGSEIDAIAEYIVPLNNTITELETSILEEENLTFQLILSSKKKDLEEFKKLEHEVDSLVLECDKLFEQVNSLAKNAIGHSNGNTIIKYNNLVQILTKVKNEHKEFKGRLLSFEKDIENGDFKHFNDNVKHFKIELKKMEKDATTMLHDMEKFLKDVTKTVEEHEQTMLKIVLITSILVFLILFLFSYFVIKNIKSSFKSFQVGLDSFFKYLDRESQEVKPLDESSKDELGRMALTINKSITRIKSEIEQDRKVISDTITVLSEFEQGDLCQRVSTKTSNPALQELTTLLNKMGSNIETNIDNILNILEKYSNNNYLERVNTTGIKEHLLKLANGINILGEVITQSLIENKKNGLALQQSATDLKENVQSLSIASNEAASSLEETAAALDEITGNVVSSSENISSMTVYASNVTKSVKEGEEQANHTMSAMDEINEQVQLINESITVIDQIAFQTNILSLNAAVEAATAGEAGKGFAVVAQEVRNLASRSAEAAKEIKEIVENATLKADNGKIIAENMLSGYTHLHSDIEKTIELIQNVDMSAKEQQYGIQQINDAVNQLDEQTQKNSASAMHANDIAINTQKISKAIIDDVNSKKFKDEEFL